MTKGNADLKRYNLVLPEELYDGVRREAESRGTTFVELMRKFIRLGLLAIDTQDKPGSAFQSLHLSGPFQ